MGWIGRVLYEFAVVVLTFIFRVAFRATISGRERIPPNGGLLVVANHLSFADPPFIGWAIPRPVEFMAMIELFRMPVLGWIVRQVAAIPVDRKNVDSRAVREAVHRLSTGNCVVIFPEGGIRLGAKSVLGGDPEIRPGATTIAELGRCPIMPVIVRNTRAPMDWRNWFRGQPIRVTFGFPFCLWSPPNIPNRARRQLAQTVLRDQLLTTAALE